MGEKKKISNKGEKKVQSIDWDSITEPVNIIGVNGNHLKSGQEYKVTKEIAKLLVKKGNAKLA